MKCLDRKFMILGAIVLLVALMLVGTQSAWAQSGGGTPAPSPPVTGGSDSTGGAATPAATSSGSTGSSGSYSGSGYTSSGSSSGSASTGAEMWLFAGIGTALIGSGIILRRAAGKRI